MALIDAQGAVISKNALIERVWSDRIVEENNLQIQISALRAAFGADRNLIRTVIAGPATPSNAASGKIANSPSPMNFRISPRWSAIVSASFLVSATQISCNRLALGVLAVGFATAFDGLVGGYFAPMGQPQRAPCRRLQRQFLSLSRQQLI
jgi:hypothetical protein